jgi:GR25 family glycosyltransferase involved in LPS biosynthesis
MQIGSFLNSFFGSVKFINLQHREDRFIHCQNQFNSIGLKADRVEAILMDDRKVGCNMSHIKALKESTGHSLIFEDDVIFSDYIDEAKQALNDLPSDWQIFYLGANHRQTPIHIKGHIGLAVEPYCCHAYAVNASFREELINIIESDGRIIDAVLGELVLNGQIKAYCSNPSLAFQIPNHSNIEERFMSYEFMVPNRDGEKINSYMT